mmetsp:Transcript_22985/g.35493  ORF Transcript_22985/g.35493 Transcript_22985/m.35493 type:complete len:91 (-) Transcript_22985:1512-1784(-)
MANVGLSQREMARQGGIAASRGIQGSIQNRAVFRHISVPQLPGESQMMEPNQSSIQHSFRDGSESANERRFGQAGLNGPLPPNRGEGMMI